jgi:hypothetical protein
VPDKPMFVIECIADVHSTARDATDAAAFVVLCEIC